MMNRDEIRRRALHAAAAVSLTFGVVACGSQVDVAQGSQTGPGEGGATDTGGVGGTGGVAAVTTTTTTSSTGGTGGEGGTVADAGVDCHQAPDWGLCCEANGWAPEAGCEAWGPPMPPAMAPVVLEVA